MEMEERSLLLSSENQALVEENTQLRSSLSSAQREVTSLKQQIVEKDDTNATLRAKVAGLELRDAAPVSSSRVISPPLPTPLLSSLSLSPSLSPLSALLPPSPYLFSLSVGRVIMNVSRVLVCACPCS